MYCLSLESFELPDSVEKIGKCAFAYCESLTKFRIPRGLILMEEGAFMHCTALAEFTGDPKTGGTAGSTDDAENEGNFPILAEDGAVYTGDGAMLLAYPCAAGIRFKVKEGTKEIGYGTFDGTSLEEVVLPGSLTKIGNYAFYGCEHLKAPAFPEGLKQLGMHCFDVQEMFFNPEDIPEEQDVIRIPASLEEIGEHAFDRFINARFEVSEDNRHYSAVDGALMNKAGDTLYYIATGPDFRAVYPDGTVEFKEDPLDAYASVSIYFTDIKEQIYLPASMTKFPEKLSNILYNTGDDTIYHCPAGSEAEKFAIRQGLRFTNEMGIPEGTAELPTQKGTMFFDLYSDHAVLTGYSGEDETLEIPAEVEGKDVTAAGNGIEPLFSSYSSIYGTDRLAPALKKCVIPEGVTDINEQAFREVSGIELILPSTLRRIGREALNINLNLSSLPEGLEILESDFGWSAGDPFTVTSKMRFTDGTCLPSVSSFELEGKKYTLPIPVSELLADGYYLDEDLNTEIGGLTYTWCDLSKEEDSYDTLTIYIFNGSGNTKALSDCVVSSIEVNDSELENYSFALGNGLKPGDLPETVEQIMGAPTDQYDSDLSLTYYYGEDRETGQIQFSWPKENGELTGSSDVSVSYFPVEKTSTSAEVPEYLSEYTAPSAMGEDFDSGTLTLDGVIYQLPCPVSEFVKNGWTVDRDDEVMADRLGSITLKKGDIPLSVYVYNFANYQTIGSNCAVTKILCSDYSDTVPIPDITLPKGLTLKTDLSTLDSIIGSSSVEFSRDDDSDSITYMYSDYDLGTSLYISYNKGTSMIDAIHYEKDIWP